MTDNKTRSVLEWRLIQLALEFSDVSAEEAAQMARNAWLVAPDIFMTMITEREKQKKKAS